MIKPSLKDYKNILKNLQTEHKNLLKISEDVDKKLRKSGRELEKVKDNIAKIILKEKVDWELLLDISAGEYAYYQYIKEMNERDLIPGNFFHDNGQRCVTISLLKDDEESYTKTLNALKEILPFIKPRKDSTFKPFKTVKIREKMLCENGIYFLLINDKRFNIEVLRNGNTRFVATFETLEVSLKHIQRYYFSQGNTISNS